MTEPAAAPVLRAEAVSAGYGGPPIIEDVSVNVYAGKIAAVVGPNGAGKSTLLKALAGVLRPSHGEVFVRGAKTTGMAPGKLVKRGLGYVPQVSNIFPDLTVKENLEMGGFTRRGGVSQRIDELCELFPDLGRSLRRRAAMLSGGQRSMLAMARALMIEPAVMLLDEPSAGLSPLLQGTLWEQIEKVASTGVGICVVEQNTRRTLRHAHWGYILVLGRNRLDGPAQELLHDDTVVDGMFCPPSCLNSRKSTAAVWIGTDVTSGSDYLKAIGYPTAHAVLTSVYGTSITGAANTAFINLFNQLFPGQKAAGPLANANYAYDAVISLALADDYAKTTGGVTVAKDMPLVTNPPGTACFTYSTCLALLKAGKKINYEGASGDLDYNKYNNTFGPYGAFQATAAGLEQQVTVMSASALAAATP